jgi:hypothetical protein
MNNENTHEYNWKLKKGLGEIVYDMEIAKGRMVWFTISDILVMSALLFNAYRFWNSLSIFFLLLAVFIIQRSLAVRQAVNVADMTLKFALLSLESWEHWYDKFAKLKSEQVRKEMNGK